MIETWHFTSSIQYPSIKTIKFSFLFSFEIFRQEWNMTCFRHLWCEKVLMVSSHKMYFTVGQAIDTTYIILKLQILINQNLCSETIRIISKVKSSHIFFKEYFIHNFIRNSLHIMQYCNLCMLTENVSTRRSKIHKKFFHKSIFCKSNSPHNLFMFNLVF